MKRFSSFRQAIRRRRDDGASSVVTPDPLPTAPEIPDETTPMIHKEFSSVDSDEVRLVEIEDEEYYNETYGHKIATFLSNYSFYNPFKNAEPTPVRGKGDEEGAPPQKYINPPSMEEAWHFFEYQSLPRRFTYIQDTGEGRKYVRASIGEKEPTKLYPVIDTPLEDLADFGIGVGLYFQTVKYFGIVSFLAGCISIPTMLYYASDTYSPGSDGGEGVSEFINSMSAVCTNTMYHPCPSCPSESDPRFNEERMLTSEDGDMSFILVNHCELSTKFGYYAFATLMFVILAVYWFVYLQRRYRIELDESEQTSTDYSIRIMNPPTSESAKDPDTWKAFFEEKFENVQVPCVTVAVNNEELIEVLLKKYELRIQLIDMLPLDVLYDEDDLDAMADHIGPPHSMSKLIYGVLFIVLFCVFFFVLHFPIPNSAIFAAIILVLFSRLTANKVTAHGIVEEMRELDAEILKLASEGDEFKVSDVFVTFETEDMQRTVLTSMCIPGFRKDEINEELKFEGVVLELEEPDEPSSMRWEDLDVPYWEEQRQKVISAILAFVFIIIGGYIIGYAETHSAIYSTIMIILLNALSPAIADSLTESESHDTQTSFAASAYVKITLIRWVYTVIVNFVITPFTKALEPDELIEDVRLLFTAETMQRPILQILDIAGHIKRHFSGPRKKDQRSMNLTFMGAPYSIGEKYTEVTKLLFFTFFYAIIFPIGFFYAAGIFLVYYWADKFCILRQWRQGPNINAEISLFSTYYLWLTVFAYALVSAYTVAEFPFDNACLTNQTVPEDYIGNTFVVHDGMKAGSNFTVGADESVYEYCNQDLAGSLGLKSFPPLPLRFENSSEWMSVPQMQIATFFGWALVGTLILVLFSFAFRLFSDYIHPMFQATWEPDSIASDMRFCDVPEIFGYVPSVEKPGMQYPILLCDVSQIDTELISWSCNFETYSVVYDVPEAYRKKSFSTIKSYEVTDVLPPAAAKYENKPSGASISSFLSYYFGIGGE